MKKMNKKGFLLAEAIIVGVFVLSLFTFLFVNVVPLVGQYESIEKYDTINGAYNANLIRTMILEDSNSEEILNLGSNPYKIYEREDLCSDTTIEKDKYCWKLLGDTYLNVDKIYITWYRTAKIKATSQKNDIDFDRAARDYIASLDDYDQPVGTTYDNYKRIIVCYNDGTFANIEVKVGSDCITDGTCPPPTTEEVSCIVTAKGTKGDNNWYTSDVNIHLTTKGSVLEYGLSTEQEVIYNYKQNDELIVDSTGTTYYGYVKDSEGFTATCSITVKRDTTGPTGPNITNPTNGNPTSQPFSLTVNSSDQESGIDYWYYSYDEENWTKYDNPSYDSYEKENFVTSEFSQERNEDVYIKVCNKAGLCSTGRTTINIDVTPPKCTLTVTGGALTNGWYTSDVTFTLNVEPSTPKYLISSQNVAKDAITSYDNLLTKKLTSDTAGIRYYAYIKDSAGNTAKCESNIVKRDTTPPNQPTITNNYHDKWVNFSYSITGTSKDDISGIDYWYYSYDNTNWTKYDDASYNSYGKESFTTSPFSIDRNGTAYIRACDQAGNCSSSGTTIIKIDTEKPTCTLSPSDSSKWYTSPTDITITSSDVSKNSVQSGVKSQNLSTSSTFSKDGTTKLNLTSDTTGQVYWCHVEDNAGNQYSISKTYKKDATPPYYNKNNSATLKTIKDNISFDAYAGNSGTTEEIVKDQIVCDYSGCTIPACVASNATSFTFNHTVFANVFIDATSGFKSIALKNNTSLTTTSRTPTYVYNVTDKAGNVQEFTIKWNISNYGSAGVCQYLTGQM